jgi:hypothetical protein
MSDEIRINRPAQQPAVRPESITEQPEAKSGVSKMPWIILGVIVLVLVVLAFMFRGQMFGKPGAAGPQGAANTTPSGASGYEAVFLTNGQVYFGKLVNPNADYLTLNDIYYLQVGPQQGSGTAAQSTSTAQQQISLVKLGNELHGPVDQMHISRAQVLFYEDLKSDGQVVKAILQDKASGTTAPVPAK